MSPKKRYLKTKKVGKGTFKLPREAVQSPARVCVVGDFNDWDQGAHPMKKLKSGDYSVTIDLEAGREYRYRYLIDGRVWENDWEADRYEPSPFADADNSVVEV